MESFDNPVAEGLEMSGMETNAIPDFIAQSLKPVAQPRIYAANLNLKVKVLDFVKSGGPKKLSQNR